MKNLFQKMKKYSFWVSFSGALIIFLNCLAKLFNFEFESAIVEEVLLAFAGVLVVLGLVVDDSNSNDDGDTNEEENTEK